MSSTSVTASTSSAGRAASAVSAACQHLERKVDALNVRLERIEMMLFFSVAVMRLHARNKAKGAADAR